MAEIDEIRQEARRNTRGRFEQWAKNPTCEANTLSAVHNIRLDKAAEAAGSTPSFGQSPFAIARGNRFEAGLFYDDAPKLRGARAQGLLCPAGSTGFPRPATQDERRRARHIGRRGARGDRGVAPAHRRRPVVRRVDRRRSDDQDPEGRDPAGGAAHHRRRHRRRRRAVDARLTVGEIKVFPDRGGHTDPQQLASARAQAGVYRHALELAVAVPRSRRRPRRRARRVPRLHVAGLELARRSGPVEDLTYQAIRAERGFERLEEVAQARRPRGRLRRRQPGADPAGPRGADRLLRGVPCVLRPRAAVPRTRASRPTTRSSSVAK